MVPAESLSLIAGQGIEGDIYFGHDKRQVLLLDKGVLAEHGYKPGELREQILVDLPGLQSLEIGTKVSVGSAEVEITMDCAPCLTMASYMGEDGESFVNKMMRRRGMLARVSKSGEVRPGDKVSAGGSG